MTIKAPHTYNITPWLADAIDTDSIATSDVKALATASATLAKAADAFASVTETSKPRVFASIASVARLDYDDACKLVRASAKDSTLRLALRTLRSAHVLRIRTCNVVHDAATDSAAVVMIDKTVTSLDKLAKLAHCVVRDFTVTAA